jgi:magnesium-transporting ATPase (P-type)
MNNHNDNPNPFLFYSSKVMSGHAKALVCCVGDQTYAARRKIQEEKEEKKQPFLIEIQLQAIRRTLSAYALLTCLTCALIQIIVAFAYNTDIYQTLSTSWLLDFIIFLVIVPEGINFALR